MTEKPAAELVIKSRSSSKCKTCGKWIVPGEMILYTPGTPGARHATPDRCATAKPSTPIPKFDRSEPAVYWAEFERVGRLLEGRTWTFGKTMPDIPHWWSVKRHWSDPEEFTRAVLRIRQFGTRRKFRSMTNIKMDVNEHYYWTMSSPLSPPERPQLINRAVRLQYEPPPAWFETWPSVSSHQATFLRRHVGGIRGRDVLDIGATWSDAAARARRYVAIGPPGDLARLATVAPSVSAIETRVAGFVPRDPERFDIVATTFGAAGHLDVDELARLPLLVRPGGCVVAMFVPSGPGHVWSPALWPDALMTEEWAYTLVRVQR